ncbi:hypothetical protein K439DRAFT_1623547 [Ramaria rubella]|nr:hypothetical protein K439DRAFT_1623547 [Ramaria rubella]
MSNIEESKSGQQNKALVHILTIDGGGIRGLSSLLLLRELMSRIAIAMNKDVSPTVIRPADCFDLIVGTGTGGISALFLGRLRMTVDEAINEYRTVAEAAFKPSSANLWCFRKSNTLLKNGVRLEAAIAEVAGRFLGDHNARLEELSTGAQMTTCRTAILACQNANVNAPPYVFRSYATTQPASHFAIHEVARATVSHQDLFPAVFLGDPPVQFMDAGFVGHNNPTRTALFEAASIWPESQIGCLVSLGAGGQKIIPFSTLGKKFIQASERIARDSEMVHNDTGRYCRNMGLLSETSIKEWKLDTSVLTGVTEGHMRGSDMDEKLDACMKVMSDDTCGMATNNDEPITAEGTGQVFDRLSRIFQSILNPAPEIFHGRDEYIEWIVETLMIGQYTHLAITGPGGIGKTSIALTVLHNARITSKFGVHSRFIACERIPPGISLVETLCAAFGLHNISADKHKDLVVFLQHIYSTTPLLLILDNFESVWDIVDGHSTIEHLLQTLGQIPKLFLVLTVRGAECPDGIQWHAQEVPQLSIEASQKMYLDICHHSHKDDENLDKLLWILGYIPLAIKLMAHLGVYFSPTILLKMWEEQGTKLLVRGESRLQNVEMSISISLASPRMTKEALELLSIIALLPGGVSYEDFTGICPNLHNRIMAAITLCRVGLAYRDECLSLQVLSPIRAYIAAEYPPSPEHIKGLQEFYFQLAELGQIQPGDCDYRTKVSRLKKAEINMEAVILRSLQKPNGNMSSVIRAALHWTSFLSWSSPRSTIIEAALKVVKERRMNDSLAYCLKSLSDIQCKLQKYDEAQETLQAAQIQFELTGGQQGVAGAARCLQTQGEIYRLCHKNEMAQELLRAAQIQYRNINNYRGVAKCLQSLGEILRAQHKNVEAQITLKTAQTQFEAINDRHGAMHCLQSQGEVLRMLHNYDEALNMLEDACSQFETIGDKRRAAQCLRSIGDIHYMCCRYHEAHHTLCSAQTLFELVGDQHGIARCLQSLGRIQSMQKKYDEAKATLQAAKSQFEAISDLQGARRCQNDLMKLQAMLQNSDEVQDLGQTENTSDSA